MKKAILSLLLITSPLLAGRPPRSGPGTTAPGNAERGRYIVENVAMCGQCHTARDGQGNLIHSQWLKGAAVPVSNPFADRLWAEFAPRILGLPQYSDKQAVRLFTEGIARTGKPLRNPMPPFRMSGGDARDVIAYLRSLE
jgi:mono/diheme cytochrome c family protein